MIGIVALASPVPLGFVIIALGLTVVLTHSRRSRLIFAILWRRFPASFLPIRIFLSRRTRGLRTRLRALRHPERFGFRRIRQIGGHPFTGLGYRLRRALFRRRVPDRKKD